MKKKISIELLTAVVTGLVLAVTVFALAATAFAQEPGLFGWFAQKDTDGWAKDKLEHLDTVAASIGETAHVMAYDSGIEIGSTTRESLLTSWDGAAFDLTLDQAYCDGTKLYYSYTLTTNGPTAHILGQGEPTGIDEWDAEFAGETYASSGIYCGEADDKAVRAFFAQNQAESKTAYAVVNHFGLGDGADMMDGTPAMIYDSGDERIDERTIRGYQEVELPEDIEVGETLAFTLSIGYGSTIYMQDADGLRWAYVTAEENRGWIGVPFTVTVDQSAVHMTGTGEIGGYPAQAHLTLSGAEAYGEAVFGGPDEWKRAFEPGEDAASDTKMVYRFLLVADGEELEALDGGFGPAGEGRYCVPLRFSLPVSRDSLVLYPVYEDAGVNMSEGIELVMN